MDTVELLSLRLSYLAVLLRYLCCTGFSFLCITSHCLTHASLWLSLQPSSLFPMGFGRNFCIPSREKAWVYSVRPLCLTGASPFFFTHIWLPLELGSPSCWCLSIILRWEGKVGGKSKPATRCAPNLLPRGEATFAWRSYHTRVPFHLCFS